MASCYGILTESQAAMLGIFPFWAILEAVASIDRPQAGTSLFGVFATYGVGFESFKAL